MGQTNIKGQDVRVRFTINNDNWNIGWIGGYLDEFGRSKIINRRDSLEAEIYEAASKYYLNNGHNDDVTNTYNNVLKIIRLQPVMEVIHESYATD